MHDFLQMLHPYTRMGHILFGAIGLFLFWLPMLSVKGQKLHRLSGRVFEKVAWIVIGLAGYGTVSYLVRFWLSGMALENHLREFSLIMMLGGLTLTAATMLYQGRAALRWKKERNSFRSNFYWLLHFTLLLSSIALIIYTILFKPLSSIVVFITAAIGLTVAYDGYQFAKLSTLRKEDWVIAHLNGMIGTGVAFYVAFGVFGSQLLFQTNSDTAGWTNALPWLVPIVFFIPLMVYWKRKARTMFGQKPKPDSNSL